jgi:hypothetical protein
MNSMPVSLTQAQKVRFLPWLLWFSDGPLKPSSGGVLMKKEKPQNPLLHAIELNSKRCSERFGEFKAAGAMWMIECRDLWDSEDEDAGVYFVECKNGYEVNDFIKKMDALSDRILGIYDLSRPLNDQGPGLTLDEWKAR